MQTVDLVVFWSSLALTLYAYVLYPLLIGLASRFARNEAAARDLDTTRMFSWPKVTLLNESIWRMRQTEVSVLESKVV